MAESAAVYIMYKKCVADRCYNTYIRRYEPYGIAVYIITLYNIISAYLYV